MNANPDSRIESSVTSRRASPEPELETPSRDPISQFISDPLLALGLIEVKRTLEIYDEELHPIYPFIDVDDVRERVASLYGELEASTGTQGIFEGLKANTFSVDIMVLKMMVATALVVEGAGKSVTGQLLLESVDAALDKSIKGIEIGLKQLQLFTLTVSFRFSFPRITKEIASQQLNLPRASSISTATKTCSPGAQSESQYESHLRWASTGKRACTPTCQILKRGIGQ